MKMKHRLIITLLIIGALLFSVVQFVVVPHNNEVERKYQIAQLDPTTHDLARILPYKNPYMGNSSKTINIFYNLPLSERGVKFQMFPKKLTLEVDYQDTVWNIGEEKVQKSIIYNSVAAFSLIGNLQKITYQFSGATYEVTRANIQHIFGKDLSLLLKNDMWKAKVQNRLNDRNFINQCMDTAILKKK